MTILEGSLTIVPRNRIGSIEIMASLEETLEDVLEVTEHPVQFGAQITDHSYKRPAQITLRCGWSDSSTESLLATISQDIHGGHVVSGNISAGIYSQLLWLQSNRVPFDVVTSLRIYGNMLITNISVPRDEKTFQALVVTITCKEVIFVSLKTITSIPLTDQGRPHSTAATQTFGPTALSPGAPSPGGAVDPSNWAAKLPVLYPQ